MSDTTRWPILKRLSEQLRQPKIWLTLLSAGFATMLVIASVAIGGIKSLTTPPPTGEFSRVLSGPPLANITNVTNTLFEDTVDKLSGGVIPILLFPNYTNYCLDSREEWDMEMQSAACVDTLNPIHIAYSEELSTNFERAYESAKAHGLDEEAERVNQWERRIAAHEFAHILQYNFQEISLPFEKKFEGGFLGKTYEDMAECYSQSLYPLSDDVAQKPGDFVEMEFHNFPKAEKIPLCTADQLDTIEQWLDALPYDAENRVS